jgi:hypothetical protein
MPTAYLPFSPSVALMDLTLLASCAEPNCGDHDEEGVCHSRAKRKPRRWHTGVILEAQQRRRRTDEAARRPAVADTRAWVFSRPASVRPKQSLGALARIDWMAMLQRGPPPGSTPDEY